MRRGAELAEPGDPEGIGLAVEVEAGHRGEADALVHIGPGLAGEHLDRVAESDQLTGEVAGVDTLTAAAWVAPIDEEGDAQPAGRRGAGSDALGDGGRVFGTLDLVPLEPEARHGQPERAGT